MEYGDYCAKYPIPTLLVRFQRRERKLVADAIPPIPTTGTTSSLDATEAPVCLHSKATTIVEAEMR